MTLNEKNFNAAESFFIWGEEEVLIGIFTYTYDLYAHHRLVLKIAQELRVFCMQEGYLGLGWRVYIYIHRSI